MAEESRPWPGTTIGDAGPFSAEDWYDAWGAIAHSGVDFSRSAEYNIGVFFAIGNALSPTENGTNIDVDTGASFVDGLYHENTATVSVPIPASGVGTSRIDYIVVRKNYQQAVTYTPAGAAPTVPPRTARITVIRGTEAGVPSAPSLTQDTTRTTYWDIPIATVEVSAGGVLSNFTDMREFVTNDFGVDIVADENTAIHDVITLETSVRDGVGDDGLGAAIRFRLENAAGSAEDAAQLAIRYSDSSASDETRAELRLKAAGSENLAAVINSPAIASVDGNNRGAGSVDFQQRRSAATEVPSGQSCVSAGGVNNTVSGDVSVNSGGFDNEVNSDYAVNSGGQGNTVSGDYASIPGGFNAVADKYGQHAHSNVQFSTGGDAQGTIQIVVGRNIASHVSGTWYDLYLNGVDATNLLTINTDTLWNFEISVVGLTQGAAQRWGYNIIGSIVNDGGTTAVITFTTTAINESDAAYDAQVVADDPNDALLVQVRRNGGSDYDVRWVATLRWAQVTYPA